MRTIRRGRDALGTAGETPAVRFLYRGERHPARLHGQDAHATAGGDRGQDARATYGTAPEKQAMRLEERGCLPGRIGMSCVKEKPG